MIFINRNLYETFVSIKYVQYTGDRNMETFFDELDKGVTVGIAVEMAKLEGDYEDYENEVETAVVFGNENYIVY